MRNILVYFLFICSVIADLNAQSAPEAKSETGSLALRLKSISFIEDNEYINPIVEGYTLLGFFLQPELVYNPSSKVSLSGGVHILKYYGSEKFSKVLPVFSTTLSLTPKTFLRIGTLNGPDMHQFFDPHFYSERLYNSYVEDGMQLTHSDKNFFTDTWISWEHFIFKGDSTREQFTAGESFRYTSDPVAELISFEIPIQVQLKHFGGQITEYKQNVESFINIAGGVKVNFDLAHKKWGQLGIEYLQFLNNLKAGDTIAGTTHGNASWLRLLYSYKAFSLQTGFWKSHDFYAPNGNPIYGNISTFQPDFVIHNRRLINNSVSIKLLAATSLELYLGVDLYYDIDTRRTDQTYTFHLNFDKLIHLSSLKQHGHQD